jgi:hypothetical protein
MFAAHSLLCLFTDLGFFFFFFLQKEEVVGLMLTKEAGLRVEDRSYLFKVFKHVFVGMWDFGRTFEPTCLVFFFLPPFPSSFYSLAGSEAVSWLVEKYSVSREEAVAFFESLLADSYCSPITDKRDFADGYYFYQFNVSSAQIIQLTVLNLSSGGVSQVQEHCTSEQQHECGEKALVEIHSSGTRSIQIRSPR